MKVILTLLSILFVINLALSQSSANPDTVCVGSTEEYKIKNPDAGSTYTWGIINGSGTIQKTSNSSVIKVKWNNTEGSENLWVYETSSAGCVGETTNLKVVRITVPTAKFKEEKLCYGQALQVVFTGEPPYNIEYSLNGNTKTASNIKTVNYMLNNESGYYNLIKVSNRHCSGKLVSGKTSATIAKPLKQLQIIRKR